MDSATPNISSGASLFILLSNGIIVQEPVEMEIA
jgi:hypothetical protein